MGLKSEVDIAASIEMHLDIANKNLKELNNQYYDALKRIGELKDENEKLKSAAAPYWTKGKTVPDLPESEKSPLSTQTKGYPSEASVKAQMRGH